MIGSAQGGRISILVICTDAKKGSPEGFFPEVDTVVIP